MERRADIQTGYIKAQQRRRYRIRLTRILLFACFLGLWQLAATAGWIDTFIFSSPAGLVKTCVELYNGQGLLGHIGVTLAETLVSFFVVAVITVAVSVLLWSFPAAGEVLEPTMVVLNALPKSALAPLLIVWLGANTKTIVLAGVSVAVFGSIMNLTQCFREVSPEACKLIHTLGGGKKQVLTKVILPASVPYLFGILKVDIGLCLVGVVIGEFIGARAGLGFLIIYASQVFKLSWLILSIVLLCILAMVLYLAICLLEKRRKY